MKGFPVEILHVTGWTARAWPRASSPLPAVEARHRVETTPAPRRDHHCRRGRRVVCHHRLIPRSSRTPSLDAPVTGSRAAPRVAGYNVFWDEQNAQGASRPPPPSRARSPPRTGPVLAIATRPPRRPPGITDVRSCSPQSRTGPAPRGSLEARVARDRTLGANPVKEQLEDRAAPQAGGDGVGIVYSSGEVNRRSSGRAKEARRARPRDRGGNGQHVGRGAAGRRVPRRRRFYVPTTTLWCRPRVDLPGGRGQADPHHSPRG